jgi:ABC-type polysaccharide/polyol phosphate export permease
MFLGQGAVTAGHLGISIAATGILLASGLLVFNRVEKTFVDTV